MTKEEFDKDSDKAVEILNKYSKHPIEKAIRNVLPKSHSLAEFALDIDISLEQVAFVVTGRRKLTCRELWLIRILYRPSFCNMVELSKLNKTIKGV